VNTPPLRRRVVALVVAGSSLIAACSDDDGATVRDLGGEDTADASGSTSGSPPGSASGSASAPASGSVDVDAGEDGGYEYASDVSSHRLVTLDVCEINELLDVDPIDFDAVAAIYVEGEHSVDADGSVRTLAGFATATDRLHGLDEYYASAAPLDDWVTSAFDGTGIFDGAIDAVRRQGVQKGIQNQVMVAWVVHELESALAKAADGDVDPGDGAPHNWDEAWAYYHGAEPGCAPFATASSRAGNFGTVGADGETALANERILEAMIDGRDALVAGDVDTARSAAREVVRNVVITYSQAAVRYATLAAADVEAGDDPTEHTIEGLAFFRVIEPIVAGAGADVDTVNEVLDPSAPGVNGGGAEVRAALQPAWDALGIAADDIGELQ
jgi:hypothetical protein